MIRNAIRQGLTAVAAIAALAIGANASAFTPPPFPRIGGIQISAPFDYNDPAYQAQLARQDVTILNMWPGLAPGGESMESVVKAIKAINPNALVFLYTNSDEGYVSGDSSVAFAPVTNQMNAQKWWLYSDAKLSSPVASFFGSGGLTINNSTNTPKDSSGDDAIDWLTKWYVNTYYSATPDIDGFFMDNVFTQPRVSGDWYRNGVVLQPSDPKAQAAIQSGYERWFSLVRQLMPGKYQIGNITTWGQNTSVPSGYQNMADGGVLEGMIGPSWAIENWSGWQNMMSQYIRDMQALKAPKLAIFNQWGDPTDYQSFRYGLASCLMNDAYYSFSSNSGGYSGVVWFDEYNAKLGQAVSPPQTGAWQNGVWRRDFTNGIALVNPKGNGPQTVQLGGTFVKIKGSQDSSVNNGQTVTSVTLKDRDGIILLRQSPLEQPKAPTGVSIGNG
ncbi:MAG TPA: putative glycoside hydrolase [Steroidobacteraceae bacterium]|jgi:hypothetical protein|nr:putative glycoside hydrolase [Steroidobacteraceae bacterium]